MPTGRYSSRLTRGFSSVSSNYSDLSGGFCFSWLGGTHGTVGVVGHQQHAGGEERAAQGTNHEARVAGLQRFNEGVGEGAVFVDGTPHQTLGDAVDPHGGDVQHGTDGRQPEVRVDQANAVHLWAAPEFRDHVVQGADGDHRYPAESAGVYVSDS